MKIQGNRLSKAMEKAGVSVEQLASAIAGPGTSAGVSVDDAASAIRNWMVGRDHPRCKAATIRRIAEVLGVRVVDIARFVSQVNNHRGSPRKAGLLIDLIRGKSYDTALNLLSFNTKRAALNIKKALNAALAEAELADADTTRLFVAESRVDMASRIKRFQPKDRGRAHAIVKPLSHITIGLEEKA